MQPRSITLLQTIDNNIEQVLQKFQDIFDVAIVEDKSKELLAVESVAIETNALTIIKLCEELLGITQGLREAWCLGSAKVSGKEDGKEGEEMKEVFDKFNRLTEKIAEVGEKGEEL